MKTTVSLIALLAMMSAGAAYAAGYSGTGASRGGFVSGTGFVKERGNDPQDKMGKDQDQPADDADEQDDVPSSADADDGAVEKGDGKKN